MFERASALNMLVNSEYTELKVTDFSLILKFMNPRAESSASQKDIPN
jgi:hypothetical protein